MRPNPIPGFLFLLFLLVATAIPRIAHPAPEEAGKDGDAALSQAGELLEEERYGEARARLAEASWEGYELGDYLLYFAGFSHAREGNLPEAVAALDNLAATFPGSPLVPYLNHDLAFASAKAGDLSAARRHFARSRGKVGGNGRKAEEGFVEARLLEGELSSGPPPGGAGNPGEGVPPPAGPKEVGEAAEEPAPGNPVPADPAAARRLAKAAAAYLDVFSAYPVEEGGELSLDRLWRWRAEGVLPQMDLPVGFYRNLAGGLARRGNGNAAAAKLVFRDALDRFPPSDEYYRLLLEYAEFLRRTGESSAARSLLARAAPEAPPAFRAEVEFLSARVDWKAGRTAEARRKFLGVADGEAPRELAERSRYQAAWISEDDGNLEASVAEFGRLRVAAEEGVRQESAFRHAYGLFRMGRNGEALAAFEEGERNGFSTVERARHAFWRGRAMRDAGDPEGARERFLRVARDPGGGAYTLLAIAELDRDPYGLFDAPSSGETAECARETERLWSRVREAPWPAEESETVRRAERLTRIGLVEFAVLEAERVNRETVRRSLGIDGEMAPAVYRYLSGDLRGAIRETIGSGDPAAKPSLSHRLQYPLAPQYFGDCDERKSGIDPLVLHSIVRQESLFQHNALSPAGAVGLMQLLPRTAAETARLERIPRKVRRKDLLRPALNIRLGAAYLSRLLREYEGDYLRAVAAYNAGEAAVARWWDAAGDDPAAFLERIGYRETRFYVRRVFFNALQYYRIYRPNMFAGFVPSALPETAPGPGAPASPPTGERAGGPPEEGKPPAGGGDGG